MFFTGLCGFLETLQNEKHVCLVFLVKIHHGISIPIRRDKVIRIQKTLTFGISLVPTKSQYLRLAYSYTHVAKTPTYKGIELVYVRQTKFLEMA